MLSNLLSGIAAKLSAAGLATKAGVGLTMAAASVTGGAAAGVLPDPVQHAVAGVANAVTPFEFPNQADDFGEQVSDDARDDEPGVDGSVIADEARQLELLVFTDEKGNPIRRQRWNDIWNRAAKTAELPPGTTPHDLRHFYASLLISKGASVKAVQTMLRHKTATETLNTYAHLWPEDNALVRRAIDAELNPIVTGAGAKDPDASRSRTSGSEEA